MERGDVRYDHKFGSKKRNKRAKMPSVGIYILFQVPKLVYFIMLVALPRRRVVTSEYY
jgi:hypothetical protein